VLVNKKLHRKVTAENASEFLAGFNER